MIVVSYQVAARGRILAGAMSERGEQKSGEDNPCSIALASRSSENQNEE
jgi:hypothetical protein